MKLPFSTEKETRELDISKIELDSAKGSFVIPGFFDIHTHGGYGYQVFDKNETLLISYLKKLLNEGVSSILITTLSAPIDKIKDYLQWISVFISKALWNKEQMAKIEGIHVEGPFINIEKKGAQNSKYIVPPSSDQIKELQEISNNNIKLITYAPETTTVDFQETLNSLGIVGSCGHSVCPSLTLRKFVKVGLSQITHTFNAMPSLHHREIGIIGEAFLNEGLSCELISDGAHVHPDAMKILIKNIGLDRLQIITDSIFAKGLENGDYDFEGLKAVKKDDSFRLKTGELAGSLARLNINVKNIQNLLDLNLNDLVRISSYNQWKHIMKRKRCFDSVFNKNKDYFIFSKELTPLFYVTNLGVKKLWK